MAASTRDAEAGWEIYRNSGFTLSLDEINERLRRLGRTPVSNRTFDHYRRMRARGLRRYMPLNRLDLLVAPNPFTDEAARIRYVSSSVDLPAQLIVAADGVPIEILGTVVSISDFGAELKVEDPDQAAAVVQLRAQPGSSVTLNLLSPAHTFYGAIDYISDVEPPSVSLGLVFTELTPVADFTGRSLVALANIRFVVRTAHESPSLDSVARDVYWLQQTVEAARAVVNLVLEAVAPQQTVPPPVVSRLSVASPTDTVLKTSIHVWLLIERLRARLEALEAPARAVLRAAINLPVVQANANLINEQAAHLREQTRSVRIENDLKEALNAAAAEVVAELMTQFRADPQAGDSIDGERLLRLLTELSTSVSELDRRGLTTYAEPDTVTADS